MATFRLSPPPMSLRSQIAGGFAVLLVPVAIIALVALSTISRLGGAVEAVLADNERSLEAVAEMDGALERLDSAALLALLGRGAEARQIAVAARPRFRDALAVAAGNLTIDGEGEIVSGVEAAFGDVERASKTLAEAAPDDARRAYARAFVPAFEQTRDRLESLEAANRQAATVAAEQAQASAQAAFWGLVLGVVLALGLGAWAAVRLSRQIAATQP